MAGLATGMLELAAGAAAGLLLGPEPLPIFHTFLTSVLAEAKKPNRDAFAFAVEELKSGGRLGERTTHEEQPCHRH